MKQSCQAREGLRDGACVRRIVGGVPDISHHFMRVSRRHITVHSCQQNTYYDRKVLLTRRLLVDISKVPCVSPRTIIGECSRALHRFDGSLCRRRYRGALGWSIYAIVAQAVAYSASQLVCKHSPSSPFELRTKQ